MRTCLTLRAASSDGTKAYEVTFDRDQGNIRITCTCPAGEIGKVCRHRLAFLRGDERMLFDRGQRDDLRTVLDWDEASAFTNLVKKLDEAERVQARAKREIAEIKKKIEAGMEQGLP